MDDDSNSSIVALFEPASGSQPWQERSAGQLKQHWLACWACCSRTRQRIQSPTRPAAAIEQAPRATLDATAIQ